jgi:hypothetical protein
MAALEQAIWFEPQQTGGDERHGRHENIVQDGQDLARWNLSRWPHHRIPSSVRAQVPRGDCMSRFATGACCKENKRKRSPLTQPE